jgi:hypothetical protein
MYCSECGVSIQADVKFCSSCGNQLSVRTNEGNVAVKNVADELEILPDSDGAINLLGFAKTSPSPHLENFLCILLGLLLISDQGINFLFNLLYESKFGSCEFDYLGLEKCLKSRNDTITSIKEKGWWIWIFISLFFIPQIIESFFYLHNIVKFKKKGVKNACPECYHYPVSWEAHVCPSCGSPSADPQIGGHYFTFFSHIFFIYACLHLASFPLSTSQKTKFENNSLLDSVQEPKNVHEELKKIHQNRSQTLENIKTSIREYYARENITTDEFKLKFISLKDGSERITGTVVISKSKNEKNTVSCNVIKNSEDIYEWSCE